MRIIRSAVALVLAATPLLAQQGTPGSRSEPVAEISGTLVDLNRSAPASSSMANNVAGRVTIRLGDVRVVRVVPGQRVELPLVVDPTAAAGASVASLTTAINWDATRLTLDSIVGASFGTLTANTANKANGSALVSVFDANGATTATTMARLFFTASPTAGGTTLVLTPTALGTPSAQNLLGTSFTQQTQACVAAPGNWGDVNGDGNVNIIDAQQIARFSVQLSVARADLMGAQGDVSADAEVNILDAQQIARNAVGLDAAPRIGSLVFVLPTIASVVVLPTTKSLGIGEPFMYYASPRTAEGAAFDGCAAVTWTSSAPANASVDTAGVVTGVGEGAASIQASVGLAQGEAGVVSGAAAGTGLRLNIASPVGASRYYALVAGGGLTSTLIARFDANFARITTMDIAVPQGTGYTVRVLAADSLSTNPDSLPVVVAGAQLTNVSVGVGRTSLGVTLESAGLQASVPTTMAAGDAFSSSVVMTDPSGLFHSVANWVNLYRGPSTFTTDRFFGSVQVFNPEVLNPTQKRFSGEPFRPTVTGTIYSQFGSGISVNGGQVVFWMFSPAVQTGAAPRQTVVTPATTGFRLNITAPAGVARFIVGVDTVGGAIAWGGVTGSNITGGVVEVPVPAGNNYRIRIAAVQEFGFTPVVFATTTGLRSGAMLSNQSVSAGNFTELNVTLAAQTPVVLPTSGVSNIPTPFNGTMRDPSRFSLESACLLRTSTSGPITGANLGTLLSNACSIGTRNPDGTLTVAGNLPATAGPATLHSMLFTSTILYSPTGERLELVHQNFNSTTIADAATTGFRLAITSPVGASRYHVYVTTATGSPANAVYKFATGFARQQTVFVPFPAVASATVRVIAADSLAADPDGTVLVAAGGRLQGISVVDGQVTDLSVTLAPITLTADIPTTASVGAPVAATVTLDDPSYVIGGVAPWANVFLSPTAPTADRTGVSVQITNFETLSPTAKRFTGSPVSPIEPGSFYSQVGIGTGIGFGTTYWAMASSLQRGEPATQTTVTTPANLATMNVNVTATAPGKIFLVAVDNGPNTNAVVRSVGSAGESSKTVSVPLANAGTYRVRAAVLDTGVVLGSRVSGILKEGAYVEGVVVAAGATVPVNITTIPVTQSVVIPTTGTVGQAIPYNGLARDPARMQEGEICVSRWSDVGPINGSGGIGTASQGCSATGRTADGTRLIAGSIPARGTAGSRWSQIVMSRAYVVSPTQVLESNQFSGVVETVVSAAPTTGIRVAITSPVGASRYYAYVTGPTIPGGQLTKLQTNFARTTTMTVPLPAGPDYRVRILAADSLSSSPDALPLLAAGSSQSGITVTDGALTDITANLAVTNVDAVVPATGTAGSALPITVTLTDPSATLGEIANWSVGYLGSTPWTADRATGSTLIESPEVLSPTQRRFSGSYTPAQSGTLYSQFGFGVTLPTGVTFWIMSNSLQRGESLRTTTVAAATSGVRVQVTSPTPVNQFLVIVDAGPGMPRVIKDIRGTAMTSAEIEVPLEAFSGWRVRVAALDSIANLSTTRMLSSLRGGGMVNGVTVTAGNFTTVPVTLTANSKNITVTPTATVGSNLTVSGTFTDPSRITSEALQCAVRYSDSGPIFPGNLGQLALTCTASNNQLDGTFSINGTIAGRTTPGTRHWLVLSNPGFLNQNGQAVEIDQTVGGSSTFTAP